MAEEQLVLALVGGLVVGVVEEQRAQGGHSRAAGLLHHGVDLGQELVAHLDGAAVDGLVPRAVRPGLLVGRAQRRVRAHERIEDPELEPPRVELRRGRLREAPDVGAHEREAREPHVREHGEGGAQGRPVGDVVARPHGGPALASRVAGPREHEGPLVGPQPGEPLEGRARVQHAVDVVDLALVGGLSLAVVAGVEGHGVVGLHEDGGLVHVVPDAGHAEVHVRLLEHPAPPFAGGGLGEIGEDAGARILLRVLWPHGRRVHGAVGVLHEGVRGQAAVVDRPALGGLGMGIDDGDDAEPLRAQVADHAAGVGEALAVPGERVVALLVMDVEPDHVGGDALDPEGVRDEADLGLRVVAVAALVVTEGPHGRQGHAARQLRVAHHDVPRHGAVDEVVVEHAVHGPEGEQAGIGLADVEAGAEGVVEEDAVGAPVAQHHEEGDGHVQGIGVVRVGVGVAVPHGVAVSAPVAPALVQLARLLAQAVDVLVLAEPLPHVGGPAREGHAARGVVLVEGLAVGAREGDAEGGVAHGHAQGRGAEDGRAGARLDGGAGIARGRLEDGPGVVAAEGGGGREPDPHHGRRERGDGHRALRVLEDERPSLAPRGGHGLERGPARGGAGGGQRQEQRAGGDHDSAAAKTMVSHAPPSAGILWQGRGVTEERARLIVDGREGRNG